MGTQSSLPPFFSKENSFLAFLSTSLDVVAFPKWGQVLKKRMCSLISKFFPFKIDPY